MVSKVSNVKLAELATSVRKDLKATLQLKRILVLLEPMQKLVIQVLMTKVSAESVQLGISVQNQDTSMILSRKPTNVARAIIVHKVHQNQPSTHVQPELSTITVDKKT